MFVIKKILILNRSESASRIQFSCQKLGIKTVAIYAPEDKYLKYVFESDQNHKLSGNGATAYLNQDEIIEIAKKTNCDAIHPGYGFLSENGDFAKKVIDSGLIWIGPSPKIIKMMGNKTTARQIAEKANVPVIPGVFFNHNEKEEAKKKAIEIGFPILLKDPLGGGGKGIIKVSNEKSSEETLNVFDSAWEQVKSISNKLTQSNQILIEKFIENGRHIEIQICGDGKNFIHLYERECSIQRRHQKIIEEAPSDFVDKKTLDAMYSAAIKIAKAIKYNNIGTVEFILTSEEAFNVNVPENKFYFLEINTRLQVEHSVTEQITGIDLVELQIEIAKNNILRKKHLMLKYQQKDISKQGHSIECRIYSEDPKNNFAPSTGKILNIQIPTTPFTRIDHNLEDDMEITPFFDPMIAKITTYGKHRNDAINNMNVVLKNFVIDGIKTNKQLLQTILKSDEFKSGKIHTQLLENPEYLKRILKKKIKKESKLISNGSEKTFNVNENQIAKVCVEKLKSTTKKKKKTSSQNFRKKHLMLWKQQQWK